MCLCAQRPKLREGEGSGRDSIRKREKHLIAAAQMYVTTGERWALDLTVKWLKRRRQRKEFFGSTVCIRYLLCMYRTVARH